MRAYEFLLETEEQEWEHITDLFQRGVISGKRWCTLLEEKICRESNILLENSSSLSDEDQAIVDILEACSTTPTIGNDYIPVMISTLAYSLQIFDIDYHFPARVAPRTMTLVSKQLNKLVFDDSGDQKVFTTDVSARTGFVKTFCFDSKQAYNKAVTMIKLRSDRTIFSINEEVFGQ